MVIVGLLNFKDPDTSYPFLMRHTGVKDPCASVNLLINVSKTKEIIVNVSKSCAIYDYIVINSKSIKSVSSFKYLGIYFDSDLKWHSNSDWKAQGALLYLLSFVISNLAQPRNIILSVA